MPEVDFAAGVRAACDEGVLAAVGDGVLGDPGERKFAAAEQGEIVLEPRRALPNLFMQALGPVP